MVEYPWADAVIVDRMDAFVPVFFESPRAHAESCKGEVKGIAKQEIICVLIKHYTNVTNTLGIPYSI